MPWCTRNYRSENIQNDHRRERPSETVTREVNERTRKPVRRVKPAALTASGFLGPQVLKVRADAIEDRWWRGLWRCGFGWRRLRCEIRSGCGGEHRSLWLRNQPGRGRE